MVILTDLESINFFTTPSAHRKKMETTLLTRPVPDEANRRAREKNIKTFNDAKGNITIVLGDTGTGKTTCYMLKAIQNGGKHIMVVPTNSAVINAEESIVGILEQMYPKTDPYENSTTIVSFTEASRGWNRRLWEETDQENMLVICNASFFNSTFHYWFDQGFHIMVDEPDDRTNLTVSPLLLRCIYTLQQKQIKYNLPRFQFIDGESKVFSNEVYYYQLQEIYIINGNSYTFDPETDKRYITMDEEGKMKETLKQCNILKNRMRPFKGKFFTSSATFPKWGVEAMKFTKLKYSTIRMVKPENPSIDIYLPHFDDAIERCLEEGNLDALLPLIEETTLKQVDYLNRFIPTFVRNLSAAEREIQEEGARKILIGLPGTFEVTQLKKMLMLTIKGERNYRNVIIMACYDRDNEKVLAKLARTRDPIIIEIVPSHELRGLNFHTMMINISPFRRFTEENGNQTVLTNKLNSMDEVKQAKGRAGRRGPRAVVYCGSKKVYDNLEQESQFDPKNLKPMLIMSTSQGLHPSELHKMNELFKGATTYELILLMEELVENGIVTLNNNPDCEDDEIDTNHYQLTRKGELHNIFHDDLEWYVNIEEYLNDNDQMSYNTLFMLLLWRQLSLTLNARTPLFKFPRIPGMGIMDVMADARDFIADYGKVHSHFDLIWRITCKIINTIPSGDHKSLKRTDTFFTGPLQSYVARAYLNPSTLRNCCHTALEQVNDLQRNRLITDLPTQPSTDFDFERFTAHKTMKDLASGDIQIATRLTNSIYVGGNGFIYKVNHDLIHPSDNDCDHIMVVHSIVKPSMLDKKMALATSILPTSALSQTELIAETLIQQGVEVDIARGVHAWLMSLKTDTPIECPFTIKPSLLGSSLAVDTYTLNLLKSIKKMQDVKASLNPEKVAEMEALFGRLAIEIAQEMTGGFDMTDMALPKAKIDIAGHEQYARFVSPANHKKAFQPDLNPETAFCPYVVTVKNDSRKGPMMVPTRYDPESSAKYTPYQILHCADLRNPTCPICKKATPGNITIEAVQQPDRRRETDTRMVNIDNMILVPRHTECTPRPESFRRCPRTGGWKFDINMNDLPMDGHKHEPVSIPQPDEDHVAHLWMIIHHLPKINEMLGTSFNDEDIKSMPFSDIKVLHNEYLTAVREHDRIQCEYDEKMRRIQIQCEKKAAEKARKANKTADAKRKASYQKHTAK